MSAPTNTKTWQYNLRNQTTAQGTALADNRKTLRAIKNALIGFSTNPWTVRYSCDSSTAGSAGDGVDKWAADTNLVWNNAGSAHSWIVLRQTGISSTYELLISCESSSASGSILTLVGSSSAFSGGSTTARPTATEEVVFLNAAQWNSSSDVSCRWNVWQSTDGQCTRIAVGHGGVHTFLAIIDKPQNPVTGWTVPAFLFATYNVTTWNLGTPALVTTTAGSALGRMRNSSTTGNVTFSVEGLSNALPTDTTVGNIANEISSEWPTYPIGLWGLTTGLRGGHGNLFDLWFISTARASADTGSSAAFAVFMPFVLPWDGGAAPSFS